MNKFKYAIFIMFFISIFFVNKIYSEEKAGIELGDIDRVVVYYTSKDQTRIIRLDIERTTSKENPYKAKYYFWEDEFPGNMTEKDIKEYLKTFDFADIKIERRKYGENERNITSSIFKVLHIPVYKTSKSYIEATDISDIIKINKDRVEVRNVNKNILNNESFTLFTFKLKQNDRKVYVIRENVASTVKYYYFYSDLDKEYFDDVNYMANFLQFCDLINTEIFTYNDILSNKKNIDQLENKLFNKEKYITFFENQKMIQNLINDKIDEHNLPLQKRNLWE